MYNIPAPGSPTDTPIQQMSQSDYLQHRVLSSQLKNQPENLPRILSASDLILYKKYQLENTIVNTAPRYQELTPPSTQPVFEINVPHANLCPTFTTCSQTNTRPNRQPVTPPTFNPYVSGGFRPLGTGLTVPAYHAYQKEQFEQQTQTAQCRCVNLRPRRQLRK